MGYIHDYRRRNGLLLPAKGQKNMSYRNFVMTSLALISALPALAAPKRCDWHAPKSKGEETYMKCMDYAAVQGTTINVPKNVTRISADGISFCQGVFTQAGAGNADIVFIYDNSTSMKAERAYVDVPKKDTLFYYTHESSCDTRDVRGSLTYATQSPQIGSRIIPFLVDNSGCNRQLSGDPYYARGEVMKEAIDYLTANAPTSTAGAVAFTTGTAHERSPLQLSVAGNADRVKQSIQLDSSGGTNYGPPLIQAKEWLSDPSMIKTSRQAIIFISDGAPNDTTGRDAYQNQIPGCPPVYSIYLGDASTPDTTKLKDLSTATGGTFTRVDPRNVAAVKQVMNSILKSITTVSVPKSVTVTNTSLAPPQTSHSTGVGVNPDGSQGVALDSIIGLGTGQNKIQISVTKSDDAVVNYAFTLNVTGDEISATGGNYSCYDVPTLTAVDASGKTPEIYSPDGKSYTLKLTHSPSELRDVSVGSVSANGDKETFPLGAGDNTLGFISHKGDFAYNPNDGSPTSGNKILEVDQAGDLTFTWSHPRDSRETVTYLLPGRVVPILDGSVIVRIKDPVTKGDAFEHPVKLTNPVVLLDGKDKCLSNCNGTDIFWTNPSIPTWLVTVKSPIKYTVHVYDNLGQFVASGTGSISQATWDQVAKSGDSAIIQMKIPPVSENGQQLGTGAYMVRAEITAMGNLVTKNAAGESVVVRNATKEYFKRFGYVRK
jgi:hypothetical protein